MLSYIYESPSTSPLPPPPKKYTDYIYGPPAITNKWCTGTVLIVSWRSSGVKNLVFHYLWSLWDPLPKLLMSKNAKWHIIRFHHLAFLRCLSCRVLGSCSNVGGPCRNIQSHQMNPMLEMNNQWCTGTILIVRWGPQVWKAERFTIFGHCGAPYPNFWWEKMPNDTS